MVDLHRHSEFSTFDGFGKAKELAQIAKELGHTSLSVSDHGNTNGLIQTYKACQDVGIKAVLGVEGYILPKYKPQTRGYHLCLFAKNLTGYGNINRIQYEGEKQKYYNPIWTLDILKKYHEGIICSSACVASYSSQCILKGKRDKAKKYLLALKKIFGDDFYIEIQPYKISEEGVQEKVNLELMKIADEIDVKCILTSDSHRGRKEDLPTYLKMHEIAGHNLKDIEATYAERYMPSEDEIIQRFCRMHGKDFGKQEAKKIAKQMVANLEEIENKVEDNILDGLPLMLPKMSENEDSYEVLKKKVIKGLKARGKYSREYIARCKKELDVIKYHGFSDYFLIVADYVNWAKKEGITVGPGRGSVCNCLVAYALKITEVDSLLFGLDFRRFLRKDKKKFPDIDIDFETSRRQEVIEYIINRYEGHAARICSYGLYKVDNLINDLAKACGLETVKGVDEDDKRANKQMISKIKAIVNKHIDETELDVEGLLCDSAAIEINEQYDNILLHFSKLYKKMRFIGTHAAGVAITSGDLLDYTSIRIDKDGNKFTSYDLVDLESTRVIKFDILGLKTMESIGELRRMTGDTVDYDEIVANKELIKHFEDGDTDGVFQFEKKAAKDILKEIKCDNFEDVVAASSMNRPGPLSLKMPEVYAENKFNSEEAKKSKYWLFTKASYGTIIYQEQVQQICINIGNMSWEDADKVMKSMKGSAMSEKAKAARDELLEKFVSGASSNGYSKKEAADLFDRMTCYAFNKGHAVGYSLISMEEMFYKVNYPEAFWSIKLKHANKEDVEKYKTFAVRSGAMIMLPHINGVAKFGLVKMFGSQCLQEGLCNIDFVGEKVAVEIEEERKRNGKYKNYADLVNRIPKRMLNNRVLNALENAGAIEFNKNKFLARVEQYNRTIYGKNWR